MGKGFHISYNPHLSKPELGCWKSNDGKPETALVIDSIKFLILNGDFRKEYEKALPKGLTECLKVFRKHKKKSRSTWSDGED
jgi:hypothetical protein